MSLFVYPEIRLHLKFNPAPGSVGILHVKTPIKLLADHSDQHQSESL